jgi:hypothetical protein
MSTSGVRDVVSDDALKPRAEHDSASVLPRSADGMKLFHHGRLRRTLTKACVGESSEGLTFGFKVIGTPRSYSSGAV